jgi:hypothetical protein
LKKYRLWRERLPGRQDTHNTTVDPKVYWEGVKVSASKRETAYFYLMTLLDLLVMRFLMASIGELSICVFEDLELSQFKASPFGGSLTSKEFHWKKRLSVRLAGLRCFIEQTEVASDYE